VNFTSGTPPAGSCVGPTFEGSAAYGSCTIIGPTAGLIASPGLPTPTGSCTPSGGTPSGTLSTQGAVTVCCEP
jgi:hypothetical protein